MKKFVIIAYDIVNNKKRNKISDLLCKYGKRINKSVFECFLSEKEFKALKETLKKKIKKGDDSILYYTLCKYCIDQIEREGIKEEEKETVKVF